MENTAPIRKKRYIGRAYVSMDTKGRITMPAKYRDLLGEGFCVAMGYDACLSVYDSEQWDRYSEELTVLSYTNSDVRYSIRTILSSAEMPEPDKQGKILLPAYHREYAGLTKEVMIMGVGDHLEIWDRERWENYSSSGDRSLEKSAEEMDRLKRGL